MGDSDTNLMQRANSSTPKQSVPTTSPNHHLNPALIRSQQSRQHPFTGNRIGVPPPIPSSISPYSQIPATLQLKHSSEDRNGAVYISPSLLPPPSPFSENLPPRKSHRRSNSDVTFGFSSMISPNHKSLERSISGGKVSDWSNLVKAEPSESFFKGARKKSESDESTMDDVFTAYMNLDNIDVLNSFGGTNENMDDMETNGGSSDSEGESSASGNVKVAVSSSSGVKRRAVGGDVASTSRHYRSISMDSCFMGKLDFGEVPPPPSSAKVSPTNSGEGNSSAHSMEFGNNSEFTAAERKKIAADQKLTEIVMADPKRVKRILANRVSAARSKERKTRYMAELEHKVQTLQTEATTLSAQLTHLQRDSMGLTNQNSELKFRLQAMEQQAQLRDALSEKLNEEVQRLKLVIGESSRRQVVSSSESNSLNPEMFQQLSISQLQHQHSNQNSTMKANRASND